MSGKDFFFSRYEQLGWKPQTVKLRQAIRLNNSNAKGKNIPGRLEAIGIHLQKISWLKEGYWVLDAQVSPGATAEYLLGYYSIQEAAAQLPVTLFSNLRGKRVLDAAAAPGGKTIQLADSMENSGIITAIDVDKRRLAALSNHLERCHISNTVVYQLDARQAPSLNAKFDRVLVDAPCSGNFAADRDWLKNRTLTDVERNARVQREILAKAVDCLSPDGELVYSTCSLEPEEDELNMDWAIKNLPVQLEEVICNGASGLVNVFGKQLDPTVARCKRFWPGETQGFFVAKLRRTQK
ncbi:MAG: RsmB/NOP family class I SAM-dependent RNA methyltransferase [Candidatus Bathyarchaeota archaeon]|nr:RsmB/NOP family class I SAM-dependent RNA methyltransferase [Candidatus Bathyarchaeota archaeon]